MGRRYFCNPFEDYKEGSSLNINKDEIITKIDEHVKTIMKSVVPSTNNVDGGLYVGISGISYMFYCLYKNPYLLTNKRFYLEKAMVYLQPALDTVSLKYEFLLGDTGTYALATIVLKELGDDRFRETYKSYRTICNKFLDPKCDSNELFVGRAGYIAGALWLSRELKTTLIAPKELYKLCDMIIESGRCYSKKHRSPTPLMYHYYNTEYLGAAHGISFILQMLLTVPDYLTYNVSAANDIKATINYMAMIQTDEGNWPCSIEEVGLPDHKLVHWCHGAPGIVYLMARAYIVYKDPQYLNACIRAADLVWQKGLLRKGPGICHGVAGNAYVFLLLNRLTGDEKYLYRAKAFADFMNTEKFLQDARLPDSPYSLYEGIAGTVCFLSDLLVPDKSEFPFQDVFAL